jgi:hypothetical protein
MLAPDLLHLLPAVSQVEQHLVNYLQTDDSGAAARGTRAVLHWLSPVAAAAFATWRQAVLSELLERTNELNASKFLQLALSLKALTGFKWAVQEAHVDRAAAGHRGGAVKKAVLRGWRQVTWYLQVRLLCESTSRRPAACCTMLLMGADWVFEAEGKLILSCRQNKR